MSPTDSAKPREAEAFGLLMQIPLQLTVEVGSCKMSVAEILKLGTGSIVELDRAANHPVDLLVNNRPIARGEIVAIDENFGLRITELFSP
jgi:flagellar motor switch protein FliN